MKKPEELQKWIHAIRRKNFVPKSSDRICSMHFRRDDFIQSQVRELRQREISKSDLSLGFGNIHERQRI